MYPELFTIPGTTYSISTFGVMMAIGFLVAYAMTSRCMEEQGLDYEAAPNILMWIMIGGVGGSKLYFAIDVSIREGVPFFDLLFARAGITWYGGLMGGALAGILSARYYGISARDFSQAAAPSLALGQALGRIGCFLVGDDYGKVTDVPWAVSFPKGAPPTNELVHPTQLYEVAWLVPVSAVLWIRRKTSPCLIGEYLVANGAGRIVIEHWRVNEQVLLGLTEPQLIGLALVALGATLWIHFWRQDRAVATA
jgi:phosphatidylglycerol:prolipoprotein diacylglycerol transferase